MQNGTLDDGDGDGDEDDLFSHQRPGRDANPGIGEEIDDDLLMAGRDPMQCFDDSDFEGSYDLDLDDDDTSDVERETGSGDHLPN